MTLYERPLRDGLTFGDGERWRTVRANAGGSFDIISDCTSDYDTYEVLDISEATFYAIHDEKWSWITPAGEGDGVAQPDAPPGVLPPQGMGLVRDGDFVFGTSTASDRHQRAWHTEDHEPFVYHTWLNDRTDLVPPAPVTS